MSTATAAKPKPERILVGLPERGDPAVVAASLPEIAQAVVDIYDAALVHLRAAATDPHTDFDAAAVVAPLVRRTEEIAAARSDLLASAVLAGAPLTPSCHAVGIAPGTLRRRLTGLVRP
mgnify:FL=1